MAEQNNKDQTAPGQVWTGEGFPALLHGKVAGVTVAVDLARNGAKVAAVDIAARVSAKTEYPSSTNEDLDLTGKLLREIGPQSDTMIGDIRQINDLRAIADKVEREFGGVDIVVANAAIQTFKPLLEMDDDDWHDTVNNNLNGTANTVRAFAPHLVKRGGGRLILVSSMQGKYGTKNGSAYSASKWGIIGLMKSAALELGKYKITVNTIEPGLIDTPLTRNDKRWSMAVGETMTAPPPEHPSEEETIKARLPKVPLGVPWLTPEQVAPVAVFLASDAAAMVTGASYDVNGGDSAHVTA